MTSTDDEKDVIKGRAIAAVKTMVMRRIIYAGKPTEIRGRELRDAEKRALDKLACIRPSKSVTIDGIKYKAVTSRNQIVTTNMRACRVCGCTDDRACEGGCYWVKPRLCSRCAKRMAVKK